jgi:hypothetical protein
MALINESEAFYAIMEIVYDLPNECEELIATMVETNCVAPDFYIEQHWAWREAGGIPHFRAKVHFDPEEGSYMIGGDYIELEIVGTLKQIRDRLKVERYQVVECRAVDPNEHYVRPF